MFFSSIKLQYSRTNAFLNKLKLLKKPLFQKRRWSCHFPLRKTLVAQKHRAISRQKKMALSPPPPHRQVAMGLPSSSPRVSTGGQAYADVRTKISRIDIGYNISSPIVLHSAAFDRKGALLLKYRLVAA